MISKKSIEEFKDVIQDEYGTELSYEQATEILMNWVRYYDLLAKIYHRMDDND